MIKRRFLIFLLISLVGFFVWPEIALANVQLSQYDTNLFLNSIQQGLFDSWVGLTTSGSFFEPEKQAALFLIRDAIQQKELNYVLIEVPKEYLIKLLKLGAKLLVSENIPLTILEEVDKKSVEKAVEIATNWLQQNEIKVATGTLNYSFTSYRGNSQSPIFYYNLAYHSLINKYGELSIEFYSPEEIEPEEPKGRAMWIGGSSWEFGEWQAAGNEKLGPFIIRIKGRVSKEKTGGYYWDKTLSVEVTFSEPVPELKTEKEEPTTLLETIKQSFKKFQQVVQKIQEIYSWIKDIFPEVKLLGGQIASLEIKTSIPTEVPESLTIKETEGIISQMEQILEEADGGEEGAEETPTQPAPPENPEAGPLETEELGQVEVLTLEEMQEILDDIAERVDIISQEVKKIAQETAKEGVAVSAETTEITFGNEASMVETDSEGLEEIEQAEIEPESSPEPSPPYFVIEGGFSPNTTLPKILISEVCAGWDKADNEFIELYNPNDQGVSLDKYDFKLKLVSSSNKVTEKRIEGLAKTIPPKGYFLLVGGEISGIAADATFSDQLSSTSGVIVTDGEDNIKDRVSWGEPEKLPPSEAIEGTGLILEDGLKTGKSLERIKIDNNLLDTDNNSQDFTLNNNPSPTNSSGYTRLYDSTPPETVLDAAPQNPSESTDADFTFHSSEENSVFDCKIDEQNWGVCSSPKNYSSLSESAHQFQVRATDSVGNTDSTPAIFSWTITIPQAAPPEEPPPEPPPLEPAAYILINEIQIDSIDGPGGVDDDWVELYNPTNQEISLSDWSIQEHSASEDCLINSGFSRKKFSNNEKGIFSIPAGGYFLIVDTQANDNLKMIADMEIGWLLTEDNTVYLVNNDETIESGNDQNIVDKVGFGQACFAEGTPAFNPRPGQSIQRKDLGRDRDNNSQDFIINTSPSPTNSKGEAGPTILTNSRITEDTIFSLSGSPYIINQAMDIPSGRTLTIEPGATLKFGQAGNLTINGTLKAIGTENKKITFTRSAADGYWQGIYFGQTSSNSELNWLKVEYAETNVIPYGETASILVDNSSILSFKNSTVENYPARGIRLINSPNSFIEGVKFFGPGRDNYNFVGIQIDGGQPTVRNSFFKNNYEGIFVKYTSGLILIKGNNFEENKYPVWSIPRAVFESNQGKNNTYDGIVLSGYINNENLTLFKNPLPYIIQNTLEVFDGKVLTIEPGTTVKFDGNTKLKVKGQLIAQGTLPENIITFAPFVPSTGYHDGIQFFHESQNSILENVVIEDCGYYVEGWEAAIYIEDTQVTFNNLTLKNSARVGLFSKNSNSIINNSHFTNNGIGIRIEGDIYPQITNSDFSNNQLCDIYWQSGGENCESLKIEGRVVRCDCCPF